jgi:phosphoglucomutase
LPAEGVSPLAGQPAAAGELVDVARLVAAYFTGRPDARIPSQRVAFGTSGHRGSSLEDAFNEAHILAITQAICSYRREHGIGGPLFLGIDTHALSVPASETALEVLAANGVDVMLDAKDGYTPTPAVSHAVLTYNRGRRDGLADGIVVTPSHNPPRDGGFKYNPPHGGPADARTTSWIENRSNEILLSGLEGVSRMPYERAVRAPSVHRHPYCEAYVEDLPSVVDLDAVRASGIRLGVDPLGGASVAYWAAIADRHGLDLEVVNDSVDPTFRFMTRDWDGQIRMDPSSRYVMKAVLARAKEFDVVVANDADADRHGIVARSAGLLEPNRYLSASIAYLFRQRPHWTAGAGIGKTMVSSALIDRVAKHLGRPLVEVPVGFKWFVPGLLEGSIGFGGEESAGASFLRRDGTVWTTDKDGLVPALLAAEITARTGTDPGETYAALTAELGRPWFTRIDVPATPEQKSRLRSASAESVSSSRLAGEEITGRLTHAPGNGEPLGGIKVTTAEGWFAARPSGTERVYKIYAESFRGEDHLEAIVSGAREIVDRLLGA